MRRPARPLFRRSPLRHFEALEGRRLLAGDVVGTVLNDLDGNGVGETALVGQQVLLYRDNGNSTFSTTTDTLVDTETTIAGGVYRFADVTAGNYFVVLGTLTDRIQLSPSATPTLLTVGDVNLTIDEFSTSQAVSASSAGSLTDSDADGTNANTGGVRDLFVQISGGTGLLGITSDFLNTSVLNVDTTGNVTGVARVTWDGTDGSATTVNASGLSLDLSNGGANTALQIRAATDQTITMRVRLYSGAGNISQVTRTVTGTDGAVDGDADELLTFDFADFLNGSLSGTTITGTGVNLSNVGAIEIELDSTGSEAFDAQLAIVGVVGDTDGPDFTVQNVMSLGNLVFLDQNNDGMFLAPTDTGIGGVVLNLLFDADRNGTFETDLGSQTTNSSGGYLFTGLAPGDYQVEVDPTNFDAALEGLFGSTGNDDSTGMPPDPDGAVDDKDRGFDDSGVIRSKPITLVGGQEIADSGNEAQNIDFGFWGFDLRIDKTPATQAAVPGETVSYTLTPSNVRPGTRGTTSTADDLGTLAEDVEVVDLLPTGLTFEPGLSTPGAAVTTVSGRQQVTYSIGNLAAGQTGATLTVVARVDSSLTAAPTQPNEARISNATEPTVYANNVVNDNLDTALLTLNTPAVSIGKRAFFWSSGNFTNPA